MQIPVSRPCFFTLRMMWNDSIAHWLGCPWSHFPRCELWELYTFPQERNSTKQHATSPEFSYKSPAPKWLETSACFLLLLWSKYFNDRSKITNMINIYIDCLIYWMEFDHLHSTDAWKLQNKRNCAHMACEWSGTQIHIYLHCVILS